MYTSIWECFPVNDNPMGLTIGHLTNQTSDLRQTTAGGTGDYLNMTSLSLIGKCVHMCYSG